MFDVCIMPVFLPISGDASRLTSLSMSNCNLSDDDVGVLFAQVGPQVRLEMLNLSVNRIGDTGIEAIVEKLVQMQTQENSLAELNLANNRVRGSCIL